MYMIFFFFKYENISLGPILCIFILSEILASCSIGMSVKAGFYTSAKHVMYSIARVY